jgi:hypothetical protein
MPKTMSKELITRVALDLFTGDSSIETHQTIIETFFGGKVFTLDALTESNWFRGIGVHCDEQLRDQILQLMKERRAHEIANRPSRNPSVVFLSSNPASKSAKPISSPPEWVRSEEEILQRLESPENADELESAILAAEITEFDDKNIPRLLKSLEAFIATHRFTVDEEEITNLGCAIRKFAMNMDSTQLDEYVDWLAPAEAKSVHNRVELELVKGLLWRLSCEPFEPAGEYAKTKETLTDVANGYLSPRLIFQKNYVSIAICSVAALFVLHSHAKDEVAISQLFTSVKQLDRDWISELVEDEIVELIDAISEHDARLRESLSNSFEVTKPHLF